MMCLKNDSIIIVDCFQLNKLKNKLNQHLDHLQSFFYKNDIIIIINELVIKNNSKNGIIYIINKNISIWTQ